MTDSSRVIGGVTALTGPWKFYWRGTVIREAGRAGTERNGGH